MGSLHATRVSLISAGRDRARSRRSDGLAVPRGNVTVRMLHRLDPILPGISAGLLLICRPASPASYNRSTTIFLVVVPLTRSVEHTGFTGGQGMHAWFLDDVKIHVSRM